MMALWAVFSGFGLLFYQLLGVQAGVSLWGFIHSGFLFEGSAVQGFAAKGLEFGTFQRLSLN